MKFTFSPLKTALTLLCLSPFTVFADDNRNEIFATNTLSEYVVRLNQIPLKDLNQNKQLSDNQLNIWEKMRKGFVMETVSPNTVRKFENYYSERPEYFGRITMRATPYLHHILTETEKRGMPSEIALLPFIESAFVIKAKSHAGAMGLWQFMPRTGKQYGLTQNNWYDGRNDIYASTDAALEYLEYLYSLFGDWSLALAAYNCGEACVARAQNKAAALGNPTSFDYLTSLPRETREYVPKLLAVRNLVKNPQRFDITLKKIKNEPYFEAVKIKQPIDLKAIAHLAEISEQEVFTLNPGYRVPVWVPQSGRKLLLPKSAIKTFYANLKKANPDDLLSWKPYRVGTNNSLSEIAQQHGMSLSELKAINYVKGDKVPKGTILLVSRDVAPAPDSVVRLDNNHDDDVSLVSYDDEEYWSEPTYISSFSDPVRSVSANKSHTKTVTATNVTTNNDNRVRYAKITIKKGVTLTAVSRHFGTTNAELQKLNKLRSGNLKIGQVLTVPVKGKYIAPRKVKLQNATYTTTNKRNASAQPVVTKKTVHKGTKIVSSSNKGRVVRVANKNSSKKEIVKPTVKPTVKSTTKSATKATTTKKTVASKKRKK